MEEQYCLKLGPEDVIIGKSQRAMGTVTKELTERGVAVFARGTCYIPQNGMTREGAFVTARAFELVCDMLVDERNKLLEERNKKWWQRRKR